VRDADGVPVDLMHGTQAVAHTLSVKGIYRFEALAPWEYIARVRIVGTPATTPIR